MFSDFEHIFLHFSVQCRKVTHNCYTQMLCINVEMNMGEGGNLENSEKLKIAF